MRTRRGRTCGQGIVSGGHGGKRGGQRYGVDFGLPLAAVQDEHVSGQRVGEKREEIDFESKYMAEALTSFGVMYEGKKDAKLKAQVRLNFKMIGMNILANERAAQARIEAEERFRKARVEAEEGVSQSARGS